ncbi:hypothetical protein J2S46_000303 [Kitasatospora herbaricolor]|nr:hypothetical protein [Kitasatospora herbaricolor]MDQ0305747.1 hypothetical protein [Kitasatospora herbaricolor]
MIDFEVLTASARREGIERFGVVDGGVWPPPPGSGSPTPAAGRSA